jgi:iron complex outermembrane receptor protein
MKKYVLLFGLIATFSSNAEIKLNEIKLNEVTVSALREPQKISDIPLMVNQSNSEEINTVRPYHINQITNRMPGVYITTTNGLGSLTSIRLPLVSTPLYLWAQDGIPLRSSGWFNSNMVAELNTAQTDSVEVIKGPTSVLYGSDAIGGVINANTKPAPSKPEAQATYETGAYGFNRGQFTGGTGGNDWGIRGNASITTSDGWRDDTDYTHKVFSTRFDKGLSNDATLKTYAEYISLDQKGAGTTRLKESDYNSTPSLNYVPISYRNSETIRLSSSYEKQFGSNLITITPYFRYNEQQQLPNYVTLTNLFINDERNKSFGFQSKFRKDFEPMKFRLITGMDYDYSPGTFTETAISTTSRTLASGARQYYAWNSLGYNNYDYSVDFKNISAYTQGEISPIQNLPLRITAGVRYDNASYDYTNNLTAKTTACENTNGNKCRPDNTSLSYDHVTTKIGATYKLNELNSIYTNYSEGFRVPTQQQLFQQGASASTIDLKPVTAVNREIGIKGKATKWLDYSVAVFEIDKKNDVISSRGLDGFTYAVNNGDTNHKGIELGAYTAITDNLQLNAVYSHTKHKYVKWAAAPRTGDNIDYSGKTIEITPRDLANITLIYKPSMLKGGSISGEWNHVGSYWMDQANTTKYEGHDLFNVRANYFITPKLQVFGRVLNITDKKYADAAVNTSTGREYAPGMPRAGFIGMEYNF